MHIYDTGVHRACPSCPFHAHAGSVTVVHAANSAMTVYAATKFGALENPQQARRLPFDDIMANLQLKELVATGPNAFYDKKDKRYVVTWTTANDADVATANPLVVCASETEDAMGEWTCWALRSTVESPSGFEFCANQDAREWFASYPQGEG